MSVILLPLLTVANDVTVVAPAGDVDVPKRFPAGRVIAVPTVSVDMAGPINVPVLVNLPEWLIGIGRVQVSPAMLDITVSRPFDSTYHIGPLAVEYPVSKSLIICGVPRLYMLWSTVLYDDVLPRWNATRLLGLPVMLSTLQPGVL